MAAAASIWAFAGGILGGSIGINHVNPASTPPPPPPPPPPRVLVIHTGPSPTERIIEGLLVGICVALMICLLVAPDYVKATGATASVHLRAAHARVVAYSNNTAFPRLRQSATEIGMGFSNMVHSARESLGKVMGDKEETGGSQLKPSPKLKSATEDGWVLV
ncbi:hypothetical protein CERZMDRAFT_101853 [Cercospora zeae-maydis SCOH1-5]|uniref:Uncharacterized protein n=1 Tax=Cercospora zeae-maydis SCOH1-5 TaxID=717836 RepID=A0A6A6F2Q3_9PEZI|nr:hypothetical protein CERZMDRAFT_101853 [Cercospora zeae-maydis SCOH1-5]